MSTSTVPARADVPVLLLAVGAPDDPQWVRALASKFRSRRTPRCSHLRRNPAEWRHVFAEEGFARCKPCADAHVAELAAGLDGTFGGAAAPDPCGGCRRPVDPARAMPVVVMALPWVVLVDVCAECEASLRRGGGES